MLIDGMGNGTRADQVGIKGKRARGLSIEGKLLARHML